MSNYCLAASRALLFTKTQDIRSLHGMTTWAFEDELMAYSRRRMRTPSLPGSGPEMVEFDWLTDCSGFCSSKW